MRTGRVNLNSSLIKTLTDSNATASKDLKPIETVFKASYFELVILGLLIATILIGNSLVCLAFKAVSRRLKTITNSFVISLAMSDILVGAFSLPLWVTLRMGKFFITRYILINKKPPLIFLISWNLEIHTCKKQIFLIVSVDELMILLQICWFNLNFQATLWRILRHTLFTLAWTSFADLHQLWI